MPLSKEHPLYSYKGVEVYPGTLEERSVERLCDNLSDTSIEYDVALGGPLVEEFADPEFKIEKFSRKNGLQIYYLLRRVIIERRRITEPISNKQLETIAIEHGFWRLHARTSLRDAWKMGLARRFVRGKFVWGRDGSTSRGKSFGVHYILRGTNG